MEDLILTDHKRSLIKEFIPTPLYIDIYKITKMLIDNNLKNALIKEKLHDYKVPFTGLGTGTNRMAVLINGYVFKIALDKDGMIDNKREMLYTKELQPYVIKVYECCPSGLIITCEYVTIFTVEYFHKYQDEMRSILNIICDRFLVGDVGISGKNYGNWGIKQDGSNQICILDFAYIYSVKYNTFICTNTIDGIECESFLQYNKTFVDFICPKCGAKYSFGDIRRRITKEAQQKEIGNIKELGYCIKSPYEEVKINPQFEPNKKNKKSDEDLVEEKWEMPEQDWDFPDQSI